MLCIYKILLLNILYVLSYQCKYNLIGYLFMNWLKKITGFNKKEDEVKDQILEEFPLVDLSEFKEKKFTVKINSKKTPLNIGDCIYIRSAATDGYPITIGGIMINGDGKISYLCEYSDVNGDTKNEMMTIEEIKRLQTRNYFN